MRILLVGFGAVGTGFARLINGQASELSSKYGFSPQLCGVVDSKTSVVSERALQANEVAARKLETGTVGDAAVELSDLLNSVSFDVLVDVTPSSLTSSGAAIERIRTGLRHGLHVVTVNKAALATAMPALMELARVNRRQLRYSGTVGAGVPMVEIAKRCSAGDQLLELRGVLNGTSNYILTRMDEGGSLAEALAEAQARGYAEPDPSADVDGVDAALKLVILANAVFGRRASIRDVRVEGIRGVEPRSGQRLIAEISADGLSVAPRPVAASDPLRVPGTYSAITLRLAHSGNITISGPGAGITETSTAIVRDLIGISHHLGESKK